MAAFQPPRCAVDDAPAIAASGPPSRAVRYVASDHFAPLLEQLGISLIVSTYQAGKLIVVGARSGRMTLEFHNFDRPMGVAHSASGQLAVAARNSIWMLRSAPDIVPRLPTAVRYDHCYLARQAQVTGEIQTHEMAWCGDELWFVNTLFSCLATSHPQHNFVPRWRPRFISGLAAEDRCHLNGMALAGGRPAWVTALGETDTPAGWRPNRAAGGVLIHVDSNEVVLRGLSMPHSPRVANDGGLVLLDSGTGRVGRVDTQRGVLEPIVQLPGYVRGMGLLDRWGWVGLSKIRETSTFGGVPIAERAEDLKCGVAFVDMVAGQTVATLEFQSGVDEIFDVTVLPGHRHVTLRGPSAEDDLPAIWTVPQPS